MVGLVCFLFILDYASLEFEFGSIQLGLLLGTALLFLGVEAGRRFIGGGGG